MNAFKSVKTSYTNLVYTTNPFYTHVMFVTQDMKKYLKQLGITDLFSKTSVNLDGIIFDCPPVDEVNSDI